MDSVAQRLSSVGAGAALELRGVTRMFGALAALTDVTDDRAPRRAPRRARLQRRRQDDAVQLHHWRFPADLRRDPLLRRGRHGRSRPTSASAAGLRRTYQISSLFPGLTVEDNVYLACRGVSRGRFSFLRPSAGDPLESLGDAVADRGGAS